MSLKQFPVVRGDRKETAEWIWERWISETGEEDRYENEKKP